MQQTNKVLRCNKHVFNCLNGNHPSITVPLPRPAQNDSVEIKVSIELVMLCYSEKTHLALCYH